MFKIKYMFLFTTIKIFIAHKLNYLTLCINLNTLQPLERIIQIVKKKEKLFERKIYIHTDAAQVIGKINVDVKEIQVDFLTIAGHKVCLFFCIFYYIL